MIVRQIEYHPAGIPNAGMSFGEAYLVLIDASCAQMLCIGCALFLACAAHPPSGLSARDGLDVLDCVLPSHYPPYSLFDEVCALIQVANVHAA